MWRLAQSQSLFLPQGSAGSARWAQKVPWGLGCRTGGAEIGGRVGSFPDALLKAAELTSPGGYPLLTLVEDYSGVLNWRGPSL